MSAPKVRKKAPIRSLFGRLRNSAVSVSAYSLPRSRKRMAPRKNAVTGIISHWGIEQGIPILFPNSYVYSREHARFEVTP